MTEILHKSEFIQTLGTLASQIIKRDIPEDISLRRQMGDTRPWQADEEHVIRTLISAVELINVCDQMVHAVEFLSGFRARKTAASGSLTRLDYMVYHLENYFIRVNMIMDRALQLVNAVFRLGIPEQECRFATVAKNEHVSLTQVAHCLRELEDILRPYRTHRNIIIHRRRYTDKGLERVEPFYILEKADLNNQEDDFIDEYYPLYKHLTDQLVRTKKAEFSAYNQTVFAKVAELFVELLPVFNEIQAKLKSAA
jgi:hypothetical protein